MLLESERRKEKGTRKQSLEIDLIPKEVGVQRQMHFGQNLGEKVQKGQEQTDIFPQSRTTQNSADMYSKIISHTGTVKLVLNSTETDTFLLTDLAQTCLVVHTITAYESGSV